MKKSSKNDITNKNLRRKAELEFECENKTTGKPITHNESLKLNHELQVHQIELKMQNEELINIRESERIANEKQVEQYDFSPIGLFTLSIKGDILELNLAGASLLGKERLHLKKSRFLFFIAEESNLIFREFINDIYKCY